MDGNPAFPVPKRFQKDKTATSFDLTNQIQIQIRTHVGMAGTLLAWPTSRVTETSELPTYIPTTALYSNSIVVCYWVANYRH
jgi:hypothetical protein